MAYDYAEVAATLNSPDARNPFTTPRLPERLKRRTAAAGNVDGFCDQRMERDFASRLCAAPRQL